MKTNIWKKIVGCSLLAMAFCLFGIFDIAVFAAEGTTNADEGDKVIKLL